MNPQNSAILLIHINVVLLHNGNKKPCRPLAYLDLMKKTYDNMVTILNVTKYKLLKQTFVAQLY